MIHRSIPDGPIGESFRELCLPWSLRSLDRFIPGGHGKEPEKRKSSLQRLDISGRFSYTAGSGMASDSPAGRRSVLPRLYSEEGGFRKEVRYVSERFLRTTTSFPIARSLADPVPVPSSLYVIYTCDYDTLILAVAGSG